MSEPSFLPNMIYQCWVSFSSTACQQQFIVPIKNVATLFGAMGALSIPFLLLFLSRSHEKKRATLALVNTIMTAPEVVERMERLYYYRKHKEAVVQSISHPPPDPYKGRDEALLFDTVIVLNYFETACLEILTKAVNDRILFECANAPVLGVRRVILKRYADMTGLDVEKYYPHIVKVSDRWDDMLQTSPVLPQIPDKKN